MIPRNSFFFVDACPSSSLIRLIVNCFFTSLLYLFFVLLAVLSLCGISSSIFYVVLLLLSTIALMAFPLHLHPNKHYMLTFSPNCVRSSSKLIVEFFVMRSAIRALSALLSRAFRPRRHVCRSTLPVFRFRSSKW